MVPTVLLVAALICFIVGTIAPYPAPSNGPLYGRVGFVSLGLFFWVLSILLGGVRLGHI